MYFVLSYVFLSARRMIIITYHGAILHLVAFVHHFREHHEILGHLVYVVRYRLRGKGVVHHHQQIDGKWIENEVVLVLWVVFFQVNLLL